MLEYDLDDAETLLQKNATAAEKSLSQTEEDLGFVRDQTTTVQVSILFSENTMPRIISFPEFQNF